MRTLIGFICLLFLSCVGYAQTAATSASLTLNWAAPTARENGVALAAAEIGGYELKYKLKTATTVNTIVIPNASARSFVLSGLPAGEYDVQIAVFDTDGLYSAFVPINYKLNLSPPKGVTGFTIKRSSIDVISLCLNTPNCKVQLGDGQ